MSPKQLAMVLPVYNEEACIVAVVGDWIRALEGLDLDFTVFVIDDGSRDGTWQQLQAFAADPRIVLQTKANQGHGPTILHGYRQAVEVAEWVFQCDSDDEMSPDHFAELWELRDGHDAAFGCRFGRSQDPLRRLVTWFSRGTVRALFGAKIRDVNTPYRLMSASSLGRILTAVPDDTFAPNVMVAGAYSLGRWRVAEMPVPHQPRATGTVSLFRWGLLKAAVRSFWQTLRFRAGIGSVLWEPAPDPDRVGSP